jgi:hypothetical protein
MKRTLLSVAALLFALTGCGPASESAPNVASNPERLQLVQDSGKPEISTDKVLRDVVGRVVKVSDVRGAGPETEWTFDADEFRQVEILERRPTQNGSTLVVFMTTRNNPQPGEDAVQVTGKLQLHYEWRAGQWALTRVENLSFRYSIGLST